MVFGAFDGVIYLKALCSEPWSWSISDIIQDRDISDTVIDKSRQLSSHTESSSVDLFVLIPTTMANLPSSHIFPFAQNSPICLGLMMSDDV